MKLRNDFCIFVISHGKPDNDTMKQLELCKVQYPIYIVIDDKDPKLQDYLSKYGKEKVCIFSKEAEASKFDRMGNFGLNKVIVFARNACYDFAKKLGYRYFIELDDDYIDFRFRVPGKKSFMFKNCKKTSLDEIFTLYVDYYHLNKEIKILAFMQGGDFSGVVDGIVLRKAMNALFCSVDRRVVFNGDLNEDVNAYTQGGKLGNIFISFPIICIQRRLTQTTGGMSDVYKLYGTYVKSFFSVIQNPSFVKIGILQQSSKFYRIHHNISTRYGVAKIISSRYKK